MFCAMCLHDLFAAGLLQGARWYDLAVREAGQVLTVAGGEALCRKHLLERWA